MESEWERGQASALTRPQFARVLAPAPPRLLSPVRVQQAQPQLPSQVRAQPLSLPASLPSWLVSSWWFAQTPHQAGSTRR